MDAARAAAGLPPLSSAAAAAVGTAGVLGAGDGGAVFAIADATSTSSSGAASPSALAAHAAVRVASCSFAENSAESRGGAVSAVGAVAAEVTGSALAFNRATAGGAIAVDVGAAANVSFSALTENAAGVSTSSLLSSSAATGGTRGFTATGSGSACALEAAAGDAAGDDGGAVWIGGGGAAVVMSDSVASLNAARGCSGGAFALKAPGATLACLNCTLASNCASVGGGAVSLSAAASVAFTRGGSASSNSALIGGFLSFASPAALASSVSLGPGLSLTDQSAVAGALYGLVSGARAFPLPACDGCAVSGNAAASYGREAATAPSAFSVSVLSADIHPGDPIHLTVALTDGFGQLVVSYPGVIVSVECRTQQALLPPPPLPASPLAASTAVAPSSPPPPASGCDAGSLAGTVDVVYRNGSAVLAPLLLGQPGTAYSLSVSVRGVQGLPALGLADTLVFVTTAQCGDLEVFDPATRLCECGPFAGRSSLGKCECREGWYAARPRAAAAGGNGSVAASCVAVGGPKFSRQELGLIIGCTVRSGRDDASSCYLFSLLD